MVTRKDVNRKYELDASTLGKVNQGFVGSVYQQLLVTELKETIIFVKIILKEQMISEFIRPFVSRHNSSGILNNGQWSRTVYDEVSCNSC